MTRLTRNFAATAGSITVEAVESHVGERNYGDNECTLDSHVIGNPALQGGEYRSANDSHHQQRGRLLQRRPRFFHKPLCKNNLSYSSAALPERAKEGLVFMKLMKIFI